MPKYSQSSPKSTIEEEEERNYLIQLSKKAGKKESI
jgi:hypothetical protein